MSDNVEDAEEISFSTNQMYKIEGEREGSWFFILNNYRYHRDTRDGNAPEEKKNTVYRCAYRKKNKCSAKVEPMYNSTLKLSGKHNCPEDENCLPEIEMYRISQQEAVNSPKKPHEILNEVCLNTEFKSVIDRFGIARADSIIRRARSSSRKIPDQLEEFGKMCNDDQTNPVHPFYRGQVKFIDGDKEQVALLYVSDLMIRELNTANKFFIDGIMKPIPPKPEGRQLWVIHIRTKSGVTLPAVFAYCNGAKSGLYKAILERLVQLAPNLKENLHTIMIDFGAAEINAVRSVFPNVRIRCCYFHYTQAITNYWYKECHLEDAPQMILFLTWALALVPWEQFQEGLQIIHQRILIHADQFPNLHIFYGYLCKQWLPKARLVSVFEEEDRTNNSAEARNHHLNYELGGRKPPLWPFIYNLAKCIQTTDTKLIRVKANAKINKYVPPKKARIDDIRIRECQEKLNKKELPLEEFLFEVLSEERKQGILEEVKILAEKYVGESYELASNENLLWAENLRSEPLERSMSTLSVPKLRSKGDVTKARENTSYELKKICVRVANETVKCLANDPQIQSAGNSSSKSALEQWVPLVDENEEYGATASHTRQKSRTYRSRGRGGSRGRGRGGSDGRGRGDSKGTSRGRGRARSENNQGSRESSHQRKSNVSRKSKKRNTSTAPSESLVNDCDPRKKSSKRIKRGARNLAHLTDIHGREDANTKTRVLNSDEF